MYSLLLFSTIAFGASVDVDTSNDDASGRYTSIFYVGEIESKDVQIIKSALERSRRAGMTQVRIFLNSTGGDVDAAIAIGREIRNAKASTWIPSMFSCASACVFVLAAGVDKFVYGAVIIHRPFAESLPKGMTYEKVRFLHSKTEAAVKQYLLEMNVSPALYDEMFSIEPQNGRSLSAQELTKYRLNQTDAAYEELRDAEMARSLGISKTTYLERKGRLNAVCSTYMGRPDQMKQCINDVFAGKR